MKKYNKDYFINLAKDLVQELDASGFTHWTKPGIRAQLLNNKTQELVQDFVIETSEESKGIFSLHILNAVSPGFTCSLPFGEYVVGRYLEREILNSSKF